MTDEHRGLPHDLPEYVPNVPPEPETRGVRRAYTTLCVGGPLDGQWRTVEGRTFEAAEPPKIEFSAAMADAVIEPFKRYRYHVENFVAFGFGCWVAVCERQFMGSAERNKAILRALLQRDVAAQMGVM